jgi:hypothetical protein
MWDLIRVRPVARASLLAAGLIALLGPVNASLATTTLVIQPMRVDLVARPGEVVEASVEVTNQSSEPLDLRTSARDVSVAGDQGQVVLGGSSPFPLTAWASVEPSELHLGAGEAASATLRITVPLDAPSGGRYGAVVFTPQVAPQAGQVTIVGEVAALVALRVRPASGQPAAREDLELSLSVPPVVWGWPVTVAAEAKNIGTVHERPSAELRLAGLLGEPRTAKLADQNVFPGGQRRLEVEVPGGPLDIGPFTAVAQATYGDSERVVQAEPVGFWVIPLGPLAALLGIGSGLWLLLGRALPAYARRAERRAIQSLQSAPEP